VVVALISVRAEPIVVTKDTMSGADEGQVAEKYRKDIVPVYYIVPVFATSTGTGNVLSSVIIHLASSFYEY
jgi:hypothetical protein